MYAAFRHFAHRTALAMGTPSAFGLALLVIILWGLTGPVFHYSDTWQLVINTGTTVITFLMVFVIQSSQNRDTKETQLKLDELLRAIATARTSLVNLDTLSDDEIEHLRRQFEALGRRAASDKPA